jgi:D-amino-acid dehydrogenase
MHVLVIGAGLAGVTTAWYLKKGGFDVTVIDRHSGPALETSYANGGQISISHPEPWANPAAPLTILRWLGRADAPLRFRLRADPQQWRWGLAFLRQCLPANARRNTEAIAALAVSSHQRLVALREELALQYDQRSRGIIHLFFSAREVRAARAKAERLEQLGIAVQLLGADECVAREPALAHIESRLAGGMLGLDDESGDAHRFAEALAGHCATQGVRFEFGTRVRGLDVRDGKMNGIEIEDAGGRRGMLAADGYVLCAGADSPRLGGPHGLRLPIYPVKGYSITAPVIDPQLAPTASLTDESRRIVCSRLGERLRVAGTAELNGYNLELEPRRTAALLEWLAEVLPGAADPARAEPWCGLRPTTPGNVPLIGRSGIDRLFLNTGHGSLGWTLACGSAAALVEIMQGRRPQLAFPFLGP